MPTYTNPKTNIKIKSKTPLSEQQLEEAFGLTSGNDVEDKPEEEMEFGDVLEGAGLPKSIDEVGPFLREGVETAAFPMVKLPQIGKHLFEDARDRTSRYWDKFADYPDVGSAAQMMMAPIPGLGNFMENADQGIAEGNPHAQGRMIGNALAVAGPKIAQKGPGVVKAVGRGAIDAGKFVANNPTARSLALGGATYAVTGSPMESFAAATLGSGRVGRVFRGLEEIANRGKAVDVTDSIKTDPTPVDPRINELKELRLRNSLAKEKGELPQGEGDISTSDVTELKRLKLERQLEYERGQALERDGGISADVTDNIEELPISHGSAVENIQDFLEFPISYKNVKLKNIEDIPKSEKAPQPPNPYSRQDPPSGTDELASVNDELSLGAEDTPKMGVAVKSHEELLMVQELMATGMDEATAVSIVTSKPNTNIPPTPKGTNPRSLGTNPRAKGTNPRALAEKRKGL